MSVAEGTGSSSMGAAGNLVGASDSTATGAFALASASNASWYSVENVCLRTCSNTELTLKFNTFRENLDELGRPVRLGEKIASNVTASLGDHLFEKSSNEIDISLEFERK